MINLHIELADRRKKRWHINDRTINYGFLRSVPCISQETHCALWQDVSTYYTLQNTNIKLITGDLNLFRMPIHCSNILTSWSKIVYWSIKLEFKGHTIMVNMNTILYNAFPRIGSIIKIFQFMTCSQSVTNEAVHLCLVLVI